MNGLRHLARPFSLLLLVGCLLSTESVQARRSGAVRQTVDMIVIHSTGGPTCDPTTGKPVWVKAGKLEENMRVIEAHPVLGIHYMIDRDGVLLKSIPEKQVAHHVFSHSARSIAIELINDGDGLDPFPEAQLATLVDLLRDLKARWGVKREAVKRHSDLDQALMPCDRRQRRKVDPGAAFPFNVTLDRVY